MVRVLEKNDLRIPFGKNNALKNQVLNIEAKSIKTNLRKARKRLIILPPVRDSHSDSNWRPNDGASGGQAGRKRCRNNIIRAVSFLDVERHICRSTG